MKFSALSVNVGDSFLLKINERYILVDGGQNQSDIVTLLDNEHIPLNHINVIICTHYDADHINGIIGILKSRKYSFDEIWLPEILGSLSYTITIKLWEILDYLRNHKESFNQVAASGSSDLPYQESCDSQLDEINYSMLDFLVTSRDKYHFSSVIYNLNSELGENLYSACSLVKSSLSSGANVRWFKYMNRVVDYNCGFNMVAKNAIETGITIYSTPQVFLQALSLTRINKESLVFMYSDEGSPNVLFTADSNLSFTKNIINLNEYSIVTAPHHGSDTNKKAYSKISGNNIYYVRSDRSQTKRPCAEYLLQTNRFCTICRNKGPKQKVVLEFINRAILTAAKKCSC